MGATVTPSWPPPPSSNPISNESNASLLEPLPLNPYYHHHHHHANPYHNSIYQTHSAATGGHHGLMTGTPPPSSGGLLSDQSTGQDSLFHPTAVHHAASFHGHHLNAAAHNHYHHQHPALNIGGLGHPGHPLSMRSSHGLSFDDLPHKGEDSEGKLQCSKPFIKCHILVLPLPQYPKSKVEYQLVE